MTAEDTIPKLLLRNYRKYGDKEVAMRRKDFGIWNEYTWKDSYQMVKNLSLGLVALGLEPGHRVSIIGDYEPELIWAIWAAQAVGGISVVIYTDMMPPEVKYIVENSDSEFVIAEDQEQVDKLLEVKDGLPKLKKVIWWDPRGLKTYDDPILTSFKEVIELGKRYEEAHPGFFEGCLNKGKADDIAAFYYTSGTTGAMPKGSILCHKALISDAAGTLKVSQITQADDIIPLFPSASIAEPVYGSVSHLLSGAKLHFAEEPETVREDSREIGPKLLTLGPRLWEDNMALVRMKISTGGVLQRLLYNLHLPIGYKVADLHFQGERPNLFWRTLYHIAYLLNFRPLKDKLGLLKTKIPITGSAAMGPDTFRFLSALGLNLRQCYGSTEGGFVTFHREDELAFDTVGPLLPEAEIRISDEGEILTRGEGLFSGYHKDAEATKKRLRDGWFHSGDAGYINDRGHLIYMDRVSELKSLATGVTYSPSYIESRLRFGSYIKDALTIGGKNEDYVSAIIDIRFGAVGDWAERNRLAYTTFVDLSQKPEVAELVKEHIRILNRSLPEHTKVRKFVLLHKEFDADEGELTRTRKLRREFMEQRYHEVIEAIYSDKEGVPIEAPVKYQDGRTGTVKTILRIWTAGEEAG